jgi:imidazoleglycerol-phosphate dehydratase
LGERYVRNVQVRGSNPLISTSLRLSETKAKATAHRVLFKIFRYHFMTRKAEIKRKTSETDISVSLNIDGTGRGNIDTQIPFMDHMLRLFSVHSFMDLDITARGDIEVDHHHTIEDIGICLGSAINEALGDRKGIARYGEAYLPMDETLVRVVLDLSNRPFLFYNVPASMRPSGSFDIGLLKEFLRALVNRGGITLHVDLIHGEEPHHVAEAVFKGLARALDSAAAPDKRLGHGIRSTKGTL